MSVSVFLKCLCKTKPQKMPVNNLTTYVAVGYVLHFVYRRVLRSAAES